MTVLSPIHWICGQMSGVRVPTRISWLPVAFYDTIQHCCQKGKISDSFIFPNE